MSATHNGHPGSRCLNLERTEGESPVVSEQDNGMAKVTFNPTVDHVHGEVGRMVYKERYGENIIAKKPDQVNQPNSPAQQAVKDTFRQAAAWAKTFLADPQMHDAYAAKAREQHSSPNAVAMADWMHEPAVTAIDLSAYTKHVGDVISIAAQDDFEVTGVMVSIEDSTHTPVESGAAAFDAATGRGNTRPRWMPRPSPALRSRPRPRITRATPARCRRPSKTQAGSGGPSQRETRARSGGRAPFAAGGQRGNSRHRWRAGLKVLYLRIWPDLLKRL